MENWQGYIQIVMFLVTISSVLIATGKILARLEEGNRIMIELRVLYADLDKRVDKHDTAIEVLKTLQAKASKA